MNDSQFLKLLQGMQNNNNALARASADRSFSQSMESQHDAQSFNAAEAEKNRQFQFDMSLSSHQREVADLKAAGLNPILSANNGAAVTSGSAASSGQTQAQKAEIDMQTAALYTNWLMNQTNNAMNLKLTKLNNANALKMSKISAAAQMAAASTAAAGQMAAAATSAAATRFAASKNYDASVYGQNMTTARNTANNISAYKLAVLNAKTQRRGQNVSVANSVIGAAGNLGSTYMNGKMNNRGRYYG